MVPGRALAAALPAAVRYTQSRAAVGALIPLLILWIVLAITADGFLTEANIHNLLVQFSVIGILAIGTTCVILSEEIDLSIGAVQGLGAVIAAIVAVRWGWPWPIALACAVAVGGLVGLVSGLITTLVGVPSFITTLGVLGVANGTALQLTEGQSIYGFPDAYQWLGQGDVGPLPASVIFAFALLIALQFMLSFTRLGLKFYAVGGNRKAADAVGMNTRRVKVTALVVSGSAAAFAGVLVSARLDAANPNIGTFDLLDAIAAVVIGGVALSGGVGSVVGTATGVLLIVSIRNGLTLHGVTPFLQTAAVGAIIIIAALIDGIARKRWAQ